MNDVRKLAPRFKRRLVTIIAGDVPISAGLWGRMTRRPCRSFSPIAKSLKTSPHPGVAVCLASRETPGWLSSRGRLKAVQSSKKFGLCGQA